jgi:CubicO group peptidase (beta-lactamase class C family)
VNDWGKLKEHYCITGFYFWRIKYQRLKKIFFLLFPVILWYGCNNSSGHKKVVDDSLQYYPPTPTALDQKEFRHYYRELNELFDTSLLKNGFNGGILIARNGSIIYEKYKGLVDLSKKDSMTDITPMHIASTSKTFTSAAILRLVQEAKLSLNDSVTKFFPGFPYPGITVKMLLNHRSGLPNYLYFMSNDDSDKKSSRSSPAVKMKTEKAEKKYAVNSDVLKFLITKKPEKSFPPNSHFSYCNTNFVLLALIVEKISGKSFPDYMKDNFFVPLKMEHTYVFTLKDTLTATPSFTNNGTHWDFDFFDGTYGDKNIYTTPRDLLKWDQALYTDQVLSKPMIDSAFAGYSFEKPSLDNYGLGWRLEAFPSGKKVVYHYGKWHGFNAAFARLPDEKATIIVLGNKFMRSIYNAAYRSYSVFGDYQEYPAINKEENDSIASNMKASQTELKKKKTTPPAKIVSKAKQ